MRILVITQHFPPETGGTPNRLLSFAKAMRRAGHEVVVVTEKPNHPKGVIRTDYQDGLFTERIYEGIPVIYTWVYTKPEKDFKTRLLFYVSFMLMAVVGSQKAKGTFDIVLASSPPLFVGISGWLAAHLKGAKFVFDVRDLWPDVAVAMGQLTDSTVTRLAKRLETFIYRRAEGITAVTDSFCRHIRAITGPDKPMARVMNGTTPEVFQQDDKRRNIRKDLDVERKFVVGYVGNHGLAQGLKHIVEAAALLEEETPDVRFLMVGSGPVKGDLEKAAEQSGLKNITFLPRVPLEDAAAHMSAADALLVPLAAHEIYRQFIPSKLFDSMAAGRPVLLSVDGEARAVLAEAEAGRYYSAEDAEGLVEQILWLQEHPEERLEMGRRGRVYSTTRGARSVQAKKMVGFLEELARRGNAPA